MRKLPMLTIALGLCLASFAQETKVTVKKEKLYINDVAVCQIEKKKKGLLAIPSFEIKTLDDKPLGYLQYRSLNAPISGTLSWYRLTFEGVEDSVQMIGTDFTQFNKSTFVQYDEALGKMIANYGLLKENAVNRDAFAQLKKDFPTDHSQQFVAQMGREAVCQKQITARAQSDSLQPVNVSLASSTEVTKYTTVMVYDVMQNGRKIGAITAKGSAKGAKQDDAEYDYSSGILDLDGASPLNYEVTNAEGCIVARYIAEEKTLGTWKDRVPVKSADLKKYNKDGVKSRLAYMQAIANYLTVKRYL